MAEIASDHVHVSVNRDRIWHVFGDAARLARVLPGCETLDESGPGVYRGVIATRLEFLTIRADATARLLDLLPPDSLRLVIEGRPRGFAGSFAATIPIRLAPAAAGGTDVAYRIDLVTSGRLATFGAPLMRDTLRSQVAQLVGNLERELGVPDRRTPGRSIDG